MKPSSNWTPELTAKLRVLFDEGHSFAQIASELAMTRNAILGKCNRLGLRRITINATRAKSAKEAHLAVRMGKKRPRWDPRRNSQAQKIQAGPKINSDSLPPTPQSDLDIPKRRRKNIFTLGPRDCKFPVGIPGEPGFLFCGAVRAQGLPYCAPHCRRAFHPAKGS